MAWVDRLTNTVDDNLGAEDSKDFCLLSVDIIFQKLVLRVLSGVPNTDKQMKALRCRLGFYCFEVFGIPDETRSMSFLNGFSVMQVIYSKKKQKTFHI